MLTILAVSLLVLSAPAWGADVNWNAADGNWTDGTKWDTGAAPLITESAATVDCGAAYTITVNSEAVCAGLEINQTNSTIDIVAGGDLTVAGCMSSYATPAGALPGALHVNGGTARISGFRHSRWGNNGGYFATVKISSGTLLPAYLTDVDGKIVDCGYRSGASATRGGILHIEGSAASITMLGGEEASGYGAFQIFDYGTVIAELDAGGVSTINVDLTQSANLLYAKGDNADLAGGTIDMRGVTPNAGDSFTLLTADVIDSTGIALDAGDAADWTLTIITGSESGLGNPNNGDNGSVVVTYIPEPASLVLLGLGGLALIRRRRR